MKHCRVSDTFVLGMAFRPSSALLSARESHYNVKYKNLAVPLHILSSNIDLTSIINETFCQDANICGGNHDKHSPEQRMQCYLLYLSYCKSNNYSPFSPGTSSFPLPETLLPSKSPILEHLRAHIEDQAMYEAGGSYQVFLKDTIEICTENRQVSYSTNPLTRTVILGQSSASEVKSFIDNFNDVQRSFATPEFGNLPFEFYSLAVEHILLNGKPKIARIHFGYWEHRWDIIIPWTYTCMDEKTFEADYHLKLGQIHAAWSSLFSLLNGYATSPSIARDVREIVDFFSSLNYGDEFRECSIKFVDLWTLLCISGWNYPHIDLTIIGFIFSGGFHQAQLEIRMGMGKWADTTELPFPLSCYLQSVHITVMNLAVIGSMCWCITWFPTPGLAGLSTRKPIKKFLYWFSQFQVALLKGASLPTRQQVEETEYIKKPKLQVETIHYDGSHKATLHPMAISCCVPSWPSITFGGCDTDIRGLSHIMEKMYPIINSPGVPLHLRWESNPNNITYTLTGNPRAKKTPKATSLGCTAGEDLLCIPDLFTEDTEYPFTIRETYRRYKSSLSDEDPLKSMNATQLLILFVWSYPVKALDMYFDTFFNSGPVYYHLNQLDILIPIFESFSGSKLRIPESYLSYRKAKCTLKSNKRYLSWYYKSTSADPVVRQKAFTAMKKIRKSQSVTHQEMLEQSGDVVDHVSPGISNRSPDCVDGKPSRDAYDPTDPILHKFESEELDLHVPCDMSTEDLLQLM